MGTAGAPEIRSRSRLRADFQTRSVPAADNGRRRVDEGVGLCGTPQVTPQVESLLAALGDAELSLKELMSMRSLTDRKSFMRVYSNPAIEAGLVERTIQAHEPFPKVPPEVAWDVLCRLFEPKGTVPFGS